MLILWSFLLAATIRRVSSKPSSVIVEGILVTEYPQGNFLNLFQLMACQRKTAKSKQGMPCAMDIPRFSMASITTSTCVINGFDLCQQCVWMRVTCFDDSHKLSQREDCDR